MQVLVVARHLNFRHAATALNISQSSVSTRIKMLEQELGVLLFERRARGVRLTEAGRQFVDEVAIGIGHLDHAIKTVGAIAQGDTGRLHMGLYAPVAYGFIAELRCRFRRRYPGVGLITIEGPCDEAVGRVIDGSLDVAFVTGQPDAPQCHCRRLWSEPLILAMPITHRFAASESLTWDALSAETFLVQYCGAGWLVYQRVLQRLGKQGRPPHILRCNVERDTLMQMIADGEGITLTYASASRVPFPGVRYITISDEPEPVRFSALWSPQNCNPALKNFLSIADRLRRSTRLADAS